jgi:EF-hand domain pair
MTKHTISALALLAMAATSNAFALTPLNKPLSTISFSATGQQLPYFVDVVEPSTPESPKAPKKKVEPNSHKEGLFSPLVLSAKKVLGEERLNKVRAQAISLHSDAIASFVATSETPFGDSALKTLFSIADKDGSGTIEEEELKEAFRILGFTWLQEKQIRGILERADLNQDGRLDIDEWKREAPKTLRTNLIKLAKKNGSDLGFLA